MPQTTKAKVREVASGEPAARPWNSTRALILSNLLTIVLAVAQRWSLWEVMWIYWGQSVVIGYYNWRKIRRLEGFSTDDFTINDRPVAPTRAVRNQVAWFFALHYGMFHFVYMMFLFIGIGEMSWLGALGAIVCVAVFAANHCRSYQRSVAAFVRRRPNIGTVMAFPYARIVPMHLTLILGHLLGTRSAGAMVLFLGLKTGADVVMHRIEHRND